VTSHAASRNQSWPHHPPTDQTGDIDTAASFLYSTPRRSHQQQPQLARLQSSESRGSRVRSAGLPCLASSPTRSFAAAEDQQAVEQPRPPRSIRPPSSPPTRQQLDARPGSPAPDPPPLPPWGPPDHARVGIFPAVSTRPALAAGAVSRGRARGLSSAAPWVAVAGFLLRPARPPDFCWRL